jgi:uncharacterized RDD family membrane protein YckC
LKNTDQLLESLGETYGYLRQYVEQRLDLLRLEAAEKSSQVLASFLTLIVIVLLLLILVAMLSITGALFIGRALGGDYALGFLIMSGVYLLAAWLIYFFRRSLITNPVLSMVIAQLFPSSEEETP